MPVQYSLRFKKCSVGSNVPSCGENSMQGIEQYYRAAHCLLLWTLLNDSSWCIQGTKEIFKYLFNSFYFKTWLYRKHHPCFHFRQLLVTCEKGHRFICTDKCAALLYICYKLQVGREDFPCHLKERKAEALFSAFHNFQSGITGRRHLECTSK